MPEMHFRVRWPDGEVQRCYSPSTVVEDHLEAGGVYTVADFVERSRQALEKASERVRAKFGMGCTAAAGQLAEITATAGGHRAEDLVTVEALILPPGGTS
jgi:uncharacterized repeat protein (TIGR04042 family)